MRRTQWIFLIGVLAASLNLRPAVASISPVLEALRADLGLSYTAVSLLTTIPTICMGVFALTIPAITDRLGRERGVYWGIILITAATAARVWSQHVLILFGSTLLVGVGIAITQALLPSLVTEYFTDRESFATGLYTASLTIGAALAGGLTAPIGDLFGSWPIALAAWAILAALAVPIWYLSWQWMEQQTTAENSKGETDRARLPWQNRWAVVLMLFFGGSSSIFYVVLAWLAPRYVALGWSSNQAGFLLSLFVLAQLGGNLVVSAVGDRLSDQRLLFALMLLSSIIGSLGIAVAPQLFPWVWALLLGIGAGGVFTLSLMLPVTYAAGPVATDGLSSMMFAGGYFIAALGPFIAGLLRDLTGSYAVSFGGLVLLGIVLLGASIQLRPGREVITATETKQSTHEGT